MAATPETLRGYRGTTLRALLKTGAKIGDLISVHKAGHTYEGYLMPRSGRGDDSHVVLKLRNGYNVGLLLDSEAKIEVLSGGMKPAFTPPPLPEEPGESLPAVWIISTGGTIASRVDYRTGAVEPALSADALYRSAPELARLAKVKTEILYSELSENIQPEHWSEIAESISKKMRSGADGVVVCMGTDTLGYASAALSFSLQDLPVPVVMVASQRSSDRPSSDAPHNLISAVWLAARSPFAEVVVAMHEGLSDDYIAVHRGVRVRKCHTSRRDAFTSVNSTPLARFNLAAQKLETLDPIFQMRDKRREPKLLNRFDNRVALLKYFPGMKSDIVESLLEQGCRGIILEGTGLGHVGRQLHTAIRKATEMGVFIGMTSQCIWGRVNMNVYYSGLDLQRLGVVPLEGIIAETATVKLMWALAHATDRDSLRRLMLSNVAGEVAGRTASGDFVKPALKS